MKIRIKYVEIVVAVLTIVLILVTLWSDFFQNILILVGAIYASILILEHGLNVEVRR